MGLTIKIEAQVNHAGEMAQQLETVLGQVVRVCAFNLEGLAKSFSRVDTGAMRAGWYTATYEANNYPVAAAQAVSKAKRPITALPAIQPNNPLEAIVANCVEYAIYNEMGTVRMSAQPMSAPAAAIVGPEFQKAIAAAIKKAAGG